MLGPLDDLHFADLRLDVPRAEAAVDDPDAPFLGLHDGHRRPRDGVHVGGDDGTPQREVLRHAARQVDGGGVAPGDDALLRCEQKIIERRTVDEPGHGLRRGRLDARKILIGHAAIVTRLTRARHNR